MQVNGYGSVLAWVIFVFMAKVHLCLLKCNRSVALTSQQFTRMGA
jgi:hypothetical protein